ncbi:MAG: hypothetical protein JSU70_14065, partial [Phycisphaerales bacterium]
MCKKFICLALFFALCTTAMGSGLALYDGSPNPGWYDETQQHADVDTIIDMTGHLFDDVQRFGDGDFEAFGEWVDQRTDDGVVDIIWLNGCMPSVLYPFPNLQPDGSRAELWLDGGDMIINVADWFGYMSYEGGVRSADNAASGAENILDLPGIMTNVEGTTHPVTEAGLQYLPSLNDPAPTEREVVLGAVVDPWEVAEIFARSADGLRADPVVIRNIDTNGHVAFINQAFTSTSIDDRGLTSA